MEVGGANREKLQQWRTRIEQAEDAYAVLGWFQHIKVEKTYADDTKKLVMVIGDESLKETLVSSLKQIGASHKVGRAPPGYFERQLSEWASTLQQP